MNSPLPVPRHKTTARRRIVTELTEEILKNPGLEDFPVGSEHQLCRRFSVSRVTVRLALGDLESHGLIYRRHGKGTYAHGRSTRSNRSLAILLKSPDALKHAPIIEIIRGAQAAMTCRYSALVLISTSPLHWPPEATRNLGAIIILPHGVTAAELAQLKTRNLPFLCLTDSQLTNAETDGFDLGQRSAEALAES